MLPYAKKAVQNPNEKLFSPIRLCIAKREIKIKMESTRNMVYKYGGVASCIE
jgi:hypothetical protein